MDDNERFDKIHRILQFIVEGDVLDFRQRKHYGKWNYREFKHIEYNESIIRGLFEILLKDKIATDVGGDSAVVDNEKVKSAYYLKEYLNKKKSKIETFLIGIAHGNNLFGLFGGILIFASAIWGSIQFLKSCGTNELPQESKKTTDTIPKVTRQQNQNLQDSTIQLESYSDSLKIAPADSLDKK